MRRLFATLLVAAALTAPSVALAASPAPSSDRSFVIQGLVLGSQKIEASGKLELVDGQIVASVGCNSIGGRASLDGDVVTVDSQLVSTEMACPGVSADTEAALIKILSLGRFTITDGGWFADGGAILAIELPNDNPGGPDQTAPDYPGGVVPGGPDASGAPVPLESCPPNQGNGTGSGGGGTVGSGATGGGSSGSGGSASSDGSAGNGTTSVGGGPTGVGSTGGGIAVPVGTPASAPGGEPGSEPGSEPVTGPDASAIAVPPATPAVEPVPIPVPVESAGAEPVPPVDPGIPLLPGSSEAPGGCYAVPADALNAAGEPPQANAGGGTASDAAERSGSLDTATWPLLAVGLVLAMAAIGMLGRWALVREPMIREPLVREPERSEPERREAVTRP